MGGGGGVKSFSFRLSWGGDSKKKKPHQNINWCLTLKTKSCRFLFLIPDNLLIPDRVILTHLIVNCWLVPTLELVNQNIPGRRTIQHSSQLPTLHNTTHNYKTTEQVKNVKSLNPMANKSVTFSSV